MNINDTIDRITYMEHCFDCLQAIENVEYIYNNDCLKNKLIQLIQYYQSGQWLLDYIADENHLLPEYLKRGVLSQDALYNFLEKINTQKL